MSVFLGTLLFVIVLIPLALLAAYCIVILIEEWRKL